MTSVTVPLQRFTVREVLGRMPEGVRWELVHGEIKIMSPAGQEHGYIAQNIARLIGNHVAEHDLGRVYAAETGFILAEDTVRAPDVAFVSRARLPEKLGAGFLHLAPDLAVEVASPSEPAEDVIHKARMWVAHGSTACWIAWPHTQSVTVVRAPAGNGNEPDLILAAADTMPDAAPLPGFTPKVGAFFA